MAGRFNLRALSIYSVGVQCVLFTCLGLFLYYPHLDNYFSYDDYNLLYHATTRSPAYIADFYVIEDSGFWRPLALLSTRLLHDLAVLNPLPYHLLCLAIHVAVVMLTGLLGRAFGLRPAAQLFAAIFVLASAANFQAVVLYQNIADLYQSVIGLLALLVLVHGRRSARVRVSAVLLLTSLLLFTKETAIAYLGPITIFLLLLNDRIKLATRPRLVVGLGAISLVALYTLWALVRQEASSNSYVHEGRFGTLAQSALQLFRYWFSLWIPYAHLTPIAGAQWIFESRALFWMGIFVTTGLVIGVYGLKTDRNLVAATWLGALSLLTLPSLLRAEIDSRYLYPAVPLFALGLAALFQAIGAGKRIFAGVIVLMLLFHFPAYRYSEFHHDHLEHSLEMEAISEAFLKFEPMLEERSRLAFLNHPYGRIEGQWPFGQFWLWVHSPERKHWFETLFKDFGQKHLVWDEGTLTYYPLNPEFQKLAERQKPPKILE